MTIYNTIPFFDDLYLFEPLGSKGLRYGGFPFVDVLEDKANEQTIIRVAVAGFHKDELKVETEKNQLIITGKHAKVEPDPYIIFREQNIKKADFTRIFTLKKGAYVADVKLENGILEVLLGFVVPEEEKRAEYVIQ